LTSVLGSVRANSGQVWNTSESVIPNIRTADKHNYFHVFLYLLLESRYENQKHQISSRSFFWFTSSRARSPTGCKKWAIMWKILGETHSFMFRLVNAATKWKAMLRHTAPDKVCRLSKSSWREGSSFSLGLTDHENSKSLDSWLGSAAADDLCSVPLHTKERKMFSHDWRVNVNHTEVKQLLAHANAANQNKWFAASLSWSLL